MPDIIKTTLTFIRFEKMLRIDAGIIVTVWYPSDDQDKILSALKSAVTKWVKGTLNGKAAWQYFSEDLNIGDLAGDLEDAYKFGSSGSSLRSYLDVEGFMKIECVSITASTLVEFDTVLANRDELGDPED